ncbi:MAG TPA: PhnD/SsuA/transferrin family substrate-binding protein [Solirubrobacterales bacterium]
MSGLNEEPLLIGAVAYHPRVVTIWERFRDYFAARELPVDFVLYSSYERLVEAMLHGAVEIGWNTNTAYVALSECARCETEILGMRDLDAGFASVLLARRGELEGEAASELAGRRLALGSRDCAHAAILPLHYLAREGLDPAAVELVRFDRDLGKHGDTGGSEREVLRAVAAGEADAGALGEPTLAALRSEGVAELEGLEVVWRSPTYYHCNFTALAGPGRERRERWAQALLEMSFEDAEMRPAMELEGVRRWLPSDEEGYRSLREAMREQGLLANPEG